MPKPRSVAALLIGSALCGSTACGPSVASVYECNIRFEHCYRLDLDPNIAPSHREACWKEWSQRYTYGQTRDRLEYARRRMATLHSGDQRRPELDLDAGAGDAATSGPAEAPMPMNAHAAPPSTLKSPGSGDAGANDAAAEAASKPASPPQAGCISDCQAVWRDCESDCGDAGTKFRCKSCQPDYRRCVQRCFK